MASRRKRTYDASGRRERAHRAHARMLDAAERLLLRDGYAATTIASIAARAGVSPESVYKTFGGKPGLVRAIRERALAGGGPVHAEARSDALQRRTRDPNAILRGWATLATEVAPRVSPILLLVRDAGAHDPQMAALWAELDDSRLARMAQNARSLGGDTQHARDVLWLFSSPEVFDLLVHRRGWSLQAYGDFLAQAMRLAIAPRRRSRPARARRRSGRGRSASRG